MEKKTAWTEIQQERTRDVLERVDILAFSFSLSGKPKKGCPLNHVSGRDGYIRSTMPSAEIGGCSRMRRMSC
ncbi:hypothetical protein SDC9_109662 [bioreactor metagenome]|uniref:Uncharacterized protein n=1 Tax=bioreactor metagenome TaxID=1076179 RepID=A0A645BLT1_9ZZZZ